MKQQNGPKFFDMDELTYEYNREIIRLPSHHPQYNPIELIWA